jgi:hypothetical protein
VQVSQKLAQSLRCVNQYRGLDGIELTVPSGIGRIPKNRHMRHVGRDPFEQLRPFPADAVFDEGKAGRVAACGPTNVDSGVTAVSPANFLLPLPKRRDARLILGVIGGKRHGLLRARHERKSACRAAERGYECSPSNVDCHVTLP